jgi:hypothetical protein
LKQILTAIGLACFAVLAYFEPLLLWLYVGSGVTLLVVIFIHRLISAKSQVSNTQYHHRVLAAGRIRRFVHKVNVEKQKFWNLLPSTRVIVCFVAVSVAALLVGAVIGASLVRIRNVGTIRAIGVEVYKDQSLTEVLHEISWGTLNPGDTKTFDAWIKNTGNDSQKLVMWTETWNPGAAQNHITLTWNYNNQPIPAGDYIPVKFTLTVDSNISDVVGFSFDVIVQGVA